MFFPTRRIFVSILVFACMLCPWCTTYVFCCHPSCVASAVFVLFVVSGSRAVFWVDSRVLMHVVAAMSCFLFLFSLPRSHSCEVTSREPRMSCVCVVHRILCHVVVSCGVPCFRVAFSCPLSCRIFVALPRVFGSGLPVIPPCLHAESSLPKFVIYVSIRVCG